jgi:hypothetical protein
MKRGWKKNYHQNLSNQAKWTHSKQVQVTPIWQAISFFKHPRASSTELNSTGAGGRSLESSGMVVLVGWGRRAWDTSSEFTVLILDWVESVLDVRGSHREEESKAYIAYTLVSVLDV